MSFEDATNIICPMCIQTGEESCLGLECDKIQDLMEGESQYEM